MGFQIAKFAAKPAARQLAMLRNIEQHGLPRAIYQGNLQRLNQNLLVPIVTEKVAVDPAVKSLALTVQRALLLRNLGLPAVKPVTTQQPAPEPTNELDLTDDAFSTHVLSAGGEDGVIDGSKFDTPTPQVGGLSAKGGKRRINQDSLLITRSADGLRILLGTYDGVGGKEKGEVASSLAAATFLDSFETNPAGFNMADAIEVANLEILRSDGDMRTTFIGALLEGNKAKFGSIGDSRIYILRNGELQIVHREDSLIDFILQSDGVIKKDERTMLSEELTQKYHDESITRQVQNVITKSLGEKEEIEFTLSEIELKEGDILLGSTDGIFGEIMFAKFKKLVVENRDRSPLEIAQALRDAVAKENDNMTIWVYKHPVEEKKEPEAEASQSWSSAKKTELTDEITTMFELDPAEKQGIVKLVNENTSIANELQVIKTRAANIIAGKTRKLRENQETLEGLKGELTGLQQELAALQVLRSKTSPNDALTERAAALIRKISELQLGLRSAHNAAGQYKASLASQRAVLEDFTRNLEIDLIPFNERLAKLEEQYNQEMAGPEMTKIQEETKRTIGLIRKLETALKKAPPPSSNMGGAMAHAANLAETGRQLKIQKNNLAVLQISLKRTSARRERRFAAAKAELEATVKKTLNIDEDQKVITEIVENIAGVEKDLATAQKQAKTISASLGTVRGDLGKMLTNEVEIALAQLDELKTTIKKTLGK